MFRSIVAAVLVLTVGCGAVDDLEGVELSHLTHEAGAPQLVAERASHATESLDVELTVHAR